MRQKPSAQPLKQAKPASSGLDLAEVQRLKKLMKFERAAFKQGFKFIAGVDEAGRGPLAGPVVSAACILPKKCFIPGVDDSKKLTAQQRHDLFEKITTDSSIIYAIGVVSPEEIDRINILQATIASMLQAIAKLPSLPDMLLVDGLHLSHTTVPCQKIIKGDQQSQSIAAASIIAKETRDRMMKMYHMEWPQYGFDRHKGYGTADHYKALESHGPCPIHRKSFRLDKKELDVECVELSEFC